jgi:O-antigen/teichoic acid export membrane protein
VDPPLLWLSLAGALFSLAGLLARRFILLRGQVGLYNAMDAGRTAMFLLLALGVALLLPRQALGGVGAWFIGEAVLAVVALAYLWRRLSARWRVSRRLMRELVAAGAPIQLGLVAIYLGGEGGAFILNARLDLAAVGVYAVTLGVARLVLQVSTALRTALQSRLVGPESDAAATTLLVTRHGLLWMALASAALALAAPLMPLVFGREFAGSEPILLLMLPGMVAYGLMQLLAGHLLRLGRRGILAVSSLTFAVASIGLQLLGTQLLGLAGAAIGLSLAYLLSAGVVLLAFVRLSGRDARELLPGNHDVRVYPALARRLISL